MTLLTFHRLSPPEKAALILNEGVHIIDRQEPKYLISLYALDGFYVELYFFKRAMQPVKINAFEDGSLLDNYLSLIDLTELHSLH